MDSRSQDESLQQPDGAIQVKAFKRDDDVTVYVTNMNPYLFTYTVTMVAEPMEEEALKRFLLSYSPLFSFLGGSEEPEAEAAGIDASKAMMDARKLMSCDELEKKIEERIARLRSDYERYLKTYDGYQDTYKIVSGAFAALMNPLATCCSLYKNSVTYNQRYPDLPDKQEFERLAKNVKDLRSEYDLESQVGELEEMIKELDERMESSSPALAKKAMADQDKIIAAAQPRGDASLERSRKANEEIRKVEEQIRRAKSEASKKQLEERKKALQDEAGAAEEEQEALQAATREKERISRNLAECDQPTVSRLKASFREAQLDFEALQDKLEGLCNNLFGGNGVKLEGMAQSVRIVLEQPDYFFIRKFKTGGFKGGTNVTLRLFRAPNPVMSLTDDQKLANEISKPLPCKRDNTPSDTDSPNDETPGEDSQDGPKDGDKPRSQNKPAKPPNEPAKENPPPASQTTSLSAPPQDQYAGSLQDVGNASYLRQVGGRRVVPAMLTIHEPISLRNISFNTLQENQEPKDTEGTTDPAPQQPQTPDQQTELKFGAPRFILSGGIAFSRLEKREFQPVLGVARDRSGMPTSPDTITNVIGLKDSSDWTLGPILVLSARLVEGNGFGLYGSFGITGKKTDNNTDIDYLFGPSVSIFDNRILFTGGAYVGRQVRLGGDAFLGAPIGADATIPTRKEYHAKFGFSVTFRVIPWK
jgi:predicted  nucleic acid-binding Zn-ribbon protein